MSTNPIIPSLGRVVLVRLIDDDDGVSYRKEAPALVNCVDSDTVISATVFPEMCDPIPAANLTYHQDDNLDAAAGSVWRWMNYQIQTAAPPPHPGAPVPQSAFDEVQPKT